MAENANLPATTAPDRAGPPASRGAGAPQVSPIRKAAILLTAIGPGLAGQFLRGIEDADLRRIAQAIAGLGQVPQALVDSVIVEFLEALATGGAVAGGTGAAKRLLGAALGEERIGQLLAEEGAGEVQVWNMLQLAPVPALVSYLRAEHPQAAAVILSELRAETAAAVLERLDRDFAQGVVVRLARVPSLDPKIAEALEGAIDRDFLSVLQRNLSKRRPADLIAGLMNNISGEARDGFLGYLEDCEPQLAQDVQRMMFTFEDVAVRISPRDIAGIVRDIPEDTLLGALKLGQMRDSPVVPFVLENVPRRLAERYAEELSAMPDIGRKAGEAAQMDLTKMVLDRVKSGQLSLLDTDMG